MLFAVVSQQIKVITSNSPELLMSQPMFVEVALQDEGVDSHVVFEHHRSTPQRGVEADNRFPRELCSCMSGFKEILSKMHAKVRIKRYVYGRQYVNLVKFLLTNTGRCVIHHDGCSCYRWGRTVEDGSRHTEIVET